ncbi:hypothetical protein [Nocardiopsis ansamitocini]|uniref:Uncharacterized protein n=1 Tax=Nocardiopsis ansamitocini TaxID=1670832 RepID=A0A9W6P3U1_9ACTN|nr:hypothetical protein [Nocardiopsis ansamitocini]GLU46523.1 hypothetical protein Nans01_08740 [Nocardiopsis ansamitocini]
MGPLSAGRVRAARLSGVVAGSGHWPVVHREEAWRPRRFAYSRADLVDSSETGGPMDGAVLGLLTALTGIAGTLASAFMVQRGAERSKARELEHAERMRAEERRHADERTALDTRRSCYVALNTAARYYHIVLTDCRHALQADLMTEELRSRLDEARVDHRAQHAEAQMVLPDTVLGAAGGVNRGLNSVYGIVKRLDSGSHPAGESVLDVEHGLSGAWGHLVAMRTVMRADLGISESGGKPADEVVQREADSSTSPEPPR